MGNALQFKIYENMKVDPPSSPPKPRPSKSKILKKAPVLAVSEDIGGFECNFEEIGKTAVADQGTRRSTSTDEHSEEHSDARPDLSRFSPKQSSANSITSSASSVLEVTSQDVESPWLQETAKEVVRETDTKKRFRLLGKLSGLISSQKRRGSQQSTTESDSSENMFRPTYQIRCGKTMHWDTQAVQLDTGSSKNLVSRHYVEDVLDMAECIETVPADIGEFVGVDGRTFCYKDIKGIVNLTWKERTSGTSQFLVLEKPPHCVIIGGEDIRKHKLLARPIQTLLHLDQTEEEIARGKERKAQQAAKKKENAEKQREEERQRRIQQQQQNAARKKTF